MGFLENLGDGLTDIVKSFTSNLTTSLANAFDYSEIAKTLNEMDESMTSVIHTMGAGRELSYMIKSNIAEAFTNVTLLGGSMSDIVDQQNALVQATNRQLILQGEYQDDLLATSRVTGEYASSLITAFDKVGMSVYSIKDEMEGVVNQARALGLNAQEVSSRMVSNLEKMNMYGFERGIAGLSTMAAKSAMFKLDMSSTFNLADKLISPEQAVDFSARLQSLGIQSELVDPFRAMDLATNDVEELQNQILKMTKGMTFFNEQTGKVEILKESRNQIKALAAEMGMTAQEFSRTIIQTETFNRKLQEIKMPSLNINEEQRTLIANLAEMKLGAQGKGYYVQIEDERGVKSEKLVSELNEKDIEQLGKQYADGNKTIEELAKDQLSYSKQMAASLTAIEKSVGVGIAGSKAGEAVVDLVQAADQLIYKPIAKALDTGNIAKTIDKAGDDLGQMFKNIEQGVSGFDGTVDGMKKLFTDTLKGLGTAVSNARSEFEKNLKRVQKLQTFESEQGANALQVQGSNFNFIPANDAFVFGDANNKTVLKPSLTDQSLFAERESMNKILGGEDIMIKMKSILSETNAQQQTQQITEILNKAQNSMSTNGQNVKHKMDPVEHKGEIKFTLDVNVPQGVDKEAVRTFFNETLRNDTATMQNLSVQLRKVVDNFNFTSAPTDTNTSYISY